MKVKKVVDLATKVYLKVNEFEIYVDRSNKAEDIKVGDLISFDEKFVYWNKKKIPRRNYE